MKKNCWEVKSCGRCVTTKGDDACPVCKEARLHGIHDGTNAGRACWTVPHTKCGDATQGTFAKKLGNCRQCDFYQLVKGEEKGGFMLSATILSRLDKQ